MHRLRCKVSSDVAELEMLHEVYGWVPGAANVRPTPVVRAQKELMFANVSAMWASPADWVCHDVFGSAGTRGPDGRRACQRPAAGQYKLVPQPWPYDLPASTEHMLLWCTGSRSEWCETDLTAAIAREIDAQGGGEFVWYENPKMSVEDAGLYHVQVFWKRAAPSGVSAAAIAAVRSMSRQSTARAECAGPAAHVGAPAGDHRGVDAPALGTEAATCGAHAPAAPDQHPSPQQTVFSSEQVERAVDAAMQLLARRIEGTVVGQDGPQAPLPE